MPRDFPLSECKGPCGLAAALTALPVGLLSCIRGPRHPGATLGTLSTSTLHLFALHPHGGHGPEPRNTNYNTFLEGSGVCGVMHGTDGNGGTSVRGEISQSVGGGEQRVPGLDLGVGGWSGHPRSLCLSLPSVHGCGLHPAPPTQEGALTSPCSQPDDPCVDSLELLPCPVGAHADGHSWPPVTELALHRQPYVYFSLALPPHAPATTEASTIGCFSAWKNLTFLPSKQVLVTPTSNRTQMSPLFEQCPLFLAHPPPP